MLSGGLLDAAGILFGEAGGTERLLGTPTHQTRNTCWHSEQLVGWFIETEGLTGVLADSGNIRGGYRGPHKH